MYMHVCIHTYICTHLYLHTYEYVHIFVNELIVVSKRNSSEHFITLCVNGIVRK